MPDSRFVVVNGEVVPEGIDITSLAYLAGVTENVQTQLNRKANDNEVVHLAGDEIINGNKSFVLPPVIPNGTAANNPVTGAQLIATAQSLIRDVNDITQGLYIRTNALMTEITNVNDTTVHLTGDEIINGNKSFVLSPAIPNGVAANNPATMAQLNTTAHDLMQGVNTITNGITQDVTSLTQDVNSLTQSLQRSVDGLMTEITNVNATTVHLAGAETITGTKTFTASPIIPEAITTDNPVTLGQLNNAIAAATPNIVAGTGIIVTQPVAPSVDTTISVDLDMPLAPLVIAGTWQVKFNDAISAVSTANSINVEQGSQYAWAGHKTWTATTDLKAPTSASVSPAGSLGTNGTVLGTSGIPLVIGFSETVAANIGTVTRTVSISAPKSGLYVDGNNIKVASGQTSTNTATVSVNIQSRLFYGKTTSNTISLNEMVVLLTPALKSSGTKNITINSITTSNNEYYWFCYPSELGDLVSITQDGATPVLTAFNGTQTLTRTFAPSISIPYKCYVSNNPGAFTNASLEFQFA